MQLSLALALLLSAADAGVGALDGTWVLDPARSSALTPLLERLDVGWLLKAGAKSARPTHVIVTGARRATIEVKSPLSSRRSVLVLDGETPLEDELFGNTVSLTSTLDGDVLVSRGQLTHRGQRLPLETRRWAHPDGSMRYLIRLAPPGEAAIELERVFTRK